MKNATKIYLLCVLLLLTTTACENKKTDLPEKTIGTEASPLYDVWYKFKILELYLGVFCIIGRICVWVRNKIVDQRKMFTDLMWEKNLV